MKTGKIKNAYKIVMQSTKFVFFACYLATEYVLAA